MARPTRSTAAAGARSSPAGRETKGERTRRRLLDSAGALLQSVGYHDLRITDVAQEAGVSTGVFYIYFKDKDELALALFGEICERAIAEVYSAPMPDDAFEAVLQTTGLYVNVTLDSGGLIRAIVQILDQLPAARALWLDLNSKVARRIASALSRRDPGAVAGIEARVIYAHAAQAMVDTLLLNLVSYQNADLKALAADRERLIQSLSVMWFRLVYGRNPPPDQCPKAVDFLPQ